MVSLMICAGGGEMGVLPEDGRLVDWIPVNYAAAGIVDILINTNGEVEPYSKHVYHILNPNIISWSELLEYFKLAGLKFTVVPTKVWLNLLLANPDNPAFTLANYFSKSLGSEVNSKFVKYSTENTLNRTTTLKCCPHIDQKSIQHYLNYWSDVGFLKHGYQRS